MWQKGVYLPSVTRARAMKTNSPTTKDGTTRNLSSGELHKNSVDIKKLQKFSKHKIYKKKNERKTLNTCTLNPPRAWQTILGSNGPCFCNQLPVMQAPSARW